jgi:hypothetical protein
MSEGTLPLTKCKEIRNSLASPNGNDVHFHISNWVTTLLRFWLKLMIKPLITLN